MNKRLIGVLVGMMFAVLFGGQVTATAASPETPTQLARRVLTASDPTAAYQLLTPAQQRTFRVEFNTNSTSGSVVTSPPPEVPLIQTFACTNYTAYASAEGWRSVAGVIVYRYYLDVKYVYDCNSVNSISITGATGRPEKIGFTYKGTSAKTNVVVPPNRARSKAQYNFDVTVPFAGGASSCLGINVTVTTAARVVGSDGSCSANP